MGISLASKRDWENMQDYGQFRRRKHDDSTKVDVMARCSYKMHLYGSYSTHTCETLVIK